MKEARVCRSVAIVKDDAAENLTVSPCRFRLDGFRSSLSWYLSVAQCRNSFCNERRSGLRAPKSELYKEIEGGAVFIFTFR